MMRIDMALHGHGIHREFQEWICRVEASASAALADWHGGKSMSSTVFRSNLRLMAFSDALTFDAEGKLAFGLMDACSCACLVELQGCWSSDARWGLRWKVTQAKYDTSPMDEPPVGEPPVGEPPVGEPPVLPAPQNYAFVDEV
jgi:hypothetical protein